MVMIHYCGRPLALFWHTEQHFVFPPGINCAKTASHFCEPSHVLLGQIWSFYAIICCWRQFKTSFSCTILNDTKQRSEGDDPVGVSDCSPTCLLSHSSREESLPLGIRRSGAETGRNASSTMPEMLTWGVVAFSFPSLHRAVPPDCADKAAAWHAANAQSRADEFVLPSLFHNCSFRETDWSKRSFNLSASASLSMSYISQNSLTWPTDAVNQAQMYWEASAVGKLFQHCIQWPFFLKYSLT